MKWNIFKKGKPNGAKPIVVSSGDDVISCEIETPQFHGSQYKFHLHKQRGTYNKKTMKFEPFEWKNGDHSVQFPSKIKMIFKRRMLGRCELRTTFGGFVFVAKIELLHPIKSTKDDR